MVQHWSNISSREINYWNIILPWGKRLNLKYIYRYSLYDPQCTGYLDKKRLEKFISDLILTMEGLKEISVCCELNTKLGKNIPVGKLQAFLYDGRMSAFFLSLWFEQKWENADQRHFAKHIVKAPIVSPNCIGRWWTWWKLVFTDKCAKSVPTSKRYYMVAKSTISLVVHAIGQGQKWFIELERIFTLWYHEYNFSIHTQMNQP